MSTDSVESQRKCTDFATQRGKQHRTKDIISWVKKRRRHIRREDLLAFLCGKTPPPRNRLSSSSSHRHGTSSRLSIERSHSPRVAGADSCDAGQEPDLQVFKEAIALQGTGLFIFMMF